MKAFRNRRKTGAQAEDLALAFLRARGLKLRARNFSCRSGEIDLIMDHGDSLVFIEVRYRRRDDYGGGLESVDARKRARIVRCARFYLHSHEKLNGRPARFDVVAVSPGQRPGEPRIHWIPNAFEAF